VRPAPLSRAGASASTCPTGGIHGSDSPAESGCCATPPDLPADRILAATALRCGLRLATADRALLQYAERNRLLKVLDMRP